MNLQVTCNEPMVEAKRMIERIAWKGFIVEGKTFGGRRVFSGEKAILMSTMVRLLGSLRTMLDQKMIAKAKRDYTGLKEDFTDALFGIFSSYKGGQIGAVELEAMWKNEIKTAWGKAYELGGKSVGNPFGVFEEDLTWLKGAELDEFGYLGKFVHDIKYGTLGMEAEGRLAMYAKTLDGVYFHGQVVGSPEFVKIHWKLREAKHCSDCIKFAAGSPYTKKTLPAVPRDGTSKCLSFCQCDLVFEYAEKVPPVEPMVIKAPKKMVVPTGYRLPTHKEADKLGAMASEIDRLRAMIDATKGEDKRNFIRLRRDLNASMIDFMETHKIYYVKGFRPGIGSMKESVLSGVKHQLLLESGLIEGGPGSGNIGHKGRPGLRGGSVSQGATQAEHISFIRSASGIEDKEFDSWEAGRRLYANAALFQMQEGSEGIIGKSNDEIVGVCSYHFDKGRVEVDRLATKRRGYGAQMMQEVCRVASGKGLNVLLFADLDAIGFYKAIGMNLLPKSISVFTFTKDQANAFAKRTE